MKISIKKKKERKQVATDETNKNKTPIIKDVIMLAKDLLPASAHNSQWIQASESKVVS